MSASPKDALVSVVMPVYNGARFLVQAIDSIRNQTYKSFEFIIINDGSKDATPEILAQHAEADSRIRVLTQENRGVIEALHRGFAAATGTYIARMDADDLAKPNRLELQVSFLNSNPGIGLVGGAVEIIDAESRMFKTVWLPESPNQLRRDMRGYGNAIAHPTVMFRREILQEVKGFRKAYLHSEDYDLWLRIMEKFDVANLRVVLLEYRRHQGSISNKNAKQQALSALCARTTAQLRLQGYPDPTTHVDLITEGVLRELGVKQETIDAAIFANMLELTEDAIRSGTCSAAADFVRMARPHASVDKLARTSLELNRKALEAPGSPCEKRKHRLMLLTADSPTYWELFRPGTRHSNAEGDSVGEGTSATKDAPMFSVVIPVYNHAKYVRQAVMSALRSPLVREVVIVDDGSSDGSATILAGLAARDPTRVRDLTKKGAGNRGAHNRLNELVEAARCSWVAVLNADDVFVDGRFEAIAADNSWPEADFLCGNLLFIDEGGRLVGAKRGPFNPGKPFPKQFDVAQMVGSGNLLDLMAHQNWIGTTSNMVFTKALHARIGGFAAFRYVHDWDFALRAMALGRCSYLRRYLTAYRMHSGNTINEGSARVDAESRALFDRLPADLPQLAERPYFRVGLEQNVNLTPLHAHKTANTEVAERDVRIPDITNTASFGPTEPHFSPPTNDYSVAVPLSYRGEKWRIPPHLAVICHIYYEDMAEEVRRYISRIWFSFDVYFTTDTQEKKSVVEKCFSGWERGKVEVRISKNQGRDVAPKFITCRDVYSRYEYVLHIHTKKSPHAERLGGWRRYLLETLLGTTEIVESVFEMFRVNPKLGMIAPQHFESIRPWIGWGQNYVLARNLAKQFGVDISMDNPMDFPSGSMFWARSAALKPLVNLKLSIGDFAAESGQADGTLSHAIERLYFFTCERAGFTWFRIASPIMARERSRIVVVDSPEALMKCIGEHTVCLLEP